MTLAVIVTLLMAASPDTALGPFRLGMSPDQARAVAGCRLKQPVGKYRAADLACSGYDFAGVKMTLTLSFANGALSRISLDRSGYSETRAYWDVDAVLRALSQDFGPLSSPELAGASVSAGAVVEYLKQKRTYATRSNLAVHTAREFPDAEIVAFVTSDRGRVPTDGFWDGHSFGGAAAPVTGSPFDLVSHSIVITVRARSRTEH
jgi:hypothetical protein